MSPASHFNWTLTHGRLEGDADYSFDYFQILKHRFITFPA